MSSHLPAEMKALVCAGVGKPLELKTIPTPTAIPGSVVVKIVAAAADYRIPHMLSGEIGFTFPSNLTPGSRAVGRIAATSIDTTSFREGQLVLLEPFIRARDDPSVQILWGMFDGVSSASKKLAADSWALGTFAEYTRVPLENCWALDETRLCGSPSDGGLGCSPAQLIHIATQAVAFGGLRAINLQAGERIIAAPASGNYSGAAVQVAVAMGANVIAMGRKLEPLRALQAQFPPGRVEVVPITGNVQADVAALKQWGPVDAYLDLSPAEAKESTHLRSCFLALRQYARVALMGVIRTDLPVPYALATWNSLTIVGKYMYEREDVRLLIKMAESGVLRVGSAEGVEVMGEFKLEQVEEAFALAAQHTGVGKMVVLAP
ncbi:chaperonin 10-like protein [Podospora didyma]|uniref:Chaperonin 10-like protein n=1 Tax=Podospora didyma TaxID=330526 RepID=A0AAE0U452_9PEZI|nr:chaperonin 10-like protein [Podospora didyma]